MDDGRADVRGQQFNPQGQATGEARQMFMAPGLKHPMFDRNMLLLPQQNLLLNDKSDSHHRGSIATASQPTVEARSSSCNNLAAAQGASMFEDASFFNDLLVNCGDRMVREC